MDIQLAPNQMKQLEALARKLGMSVEQALLEVLGRALHSAIKPGGT